METFVVDLDLYAGPLDLLLYLIRRSEIELTSVSLAKISRQYCEFLEIIELISIDEVGDFVEIASTLIEMKSKAVLPTAATEEHTPQVDESADDQLVQRLLEYKRFRDAAAMLDERGDAWQRQYTRQTIDLRPAAVDASEQPLVRIEIWDLVSAFGRILRERQPPPSEAVVYDDTPMQVYMHRIHSRVVAEGECELQSFFEPGQHKSTLVTLFLAMLELVRHHGLRTRQIGIGGPILLSAGEQFKTTLELSDAEHHNANRLESSNFAYRPR